MLQIRDDAILPAIQ